jgi:ribosomal protein S9
MANYQTVTAVKLGQAAITGTIATLYTTPALSKTYVKQLDIANTTNGSLDVNVHLVPVSGTAGTANAILYTVAVAQHTTYQWKGIQVMNAGETLQVKASSTGLTITASGGEAV